MSGIVGKTTVTEKGQITIPAGIRRKEGIKPNDELFVVGADGAIVITKPQKGKLAQLFRQASGMVTHEEIRKMRLCADTWFLLELSKGENDSVKLLEEIEKGVHELFVPALALSEFFTILYQKDQTSLAESIFAQIMVPGNIRIVPVDEKLCIRIAKIKHSFGLSISDASIVAACKITNSDVLLAEDSDFSAAAKQNYVKIGRRKTY